MPKITIGELKDVLVATNKFNEIALRDGLYGPEPGKKAKLEGIIAGINVALNLIKNG
jgi:hypothetical protein